MTEVTHTFSAAEVITAAKVNQNFTDLEDAVDDISNANLRTDAGITSAKLADRYAPICWGPFAVIPYHHSDTWALADTIIVPAAETLFAAFKLRVPSGKKAFICVVEAHVRAVVIGAGPSTPKLTVKKGTTTLGGAAVDLDTNDKHYSIEYASPYANPLIAVQDGDVIEIYLSASGAAAEVSALTVALHGKIEVTA